MCIIAVKKKNVDFPSKEILKTCFQNNSDGAGIMYIKNKKVIIEKGFMNFNDFYKRVEQIKKEFKDYNKKEFIFHFRIATSGATNGKTCHPFPVSKKIKDLQKTKIKTNLALVHNGIISNFVYGELSDTQNFTRDFIYQIYKNNKRFYHDKKITKMIGKVADSKVCLLDNEGTIRLIGDFITDKQTGLIFSNNTYKKSTYDWSNYYTYDWESYYKNKYGEHYGSY